jgi:hypothetical protein
MDNVQAVINRLENLEQRLNRSLGILDTAVRIARTADGRTGSKTAAEVCTVALDETRVCLSLLRSKE